jgi:hypothetical protein
VYEDVTAPEPVEPRPQMMSQAAFARLIGVDSMAVHHAIKRGRLDRSIVKDADGKPKIADVDLARREWAENTSIGHVRRPEYVDAALARSAVPTAPSSDPPADDLSPAQRKAHWDALTAEKKFREEAGELVPAKEVEAALTETFAVCKNKLRAIPSRAKQEMPHLSVDDVEVLARLIDEACEGLAVEA